MVVRWQTFKGTSTSDQSRGGVEFAVPVLVSIHTCSPQDVPFSEQDLHTLTLHKRHCGSLYRNHQDLGDGLWRTEPIVSAALPASSLSICPGIFVVSQMPVPAAVGFRADTASPFPDQTLRVDETKRRDDLE